MELDSGDHRPNDLKQSAASVFGLHPNYASNGFGVTAVKQWDKFSIGGLHCGHHAVAKLVASATNGFVLDLPSKVDVTPVELCVTRNGQQNG